MPTIKITFGYAIGHPDDDYEEIDGEFEQAEEAIAFIKTCFQDYERAQAHQEYHAEAEAEELALKSEEEKNI